MLRFKLFVARLSKVCQAAQVQAIAVDYHGYWILSTNGIRGYIESLHNQGKAYLMRYPYDMVEGVHVCPINHSLYIYKYFSRGREYRYVRLIRVTTGRVGVVITNITTETVTPRKFCGFVEGGGIRISCTSRGCVIAVPNYGKLIPAYLPDWLLDIVVAVKLCMGGGNTWELGMADLTDNVLARMLSHGYTL